MYGGAKAFMAYRKTHNGNPPTLLFFLSPPFQLLFHFISFLLHHYSLSRPILLQLFSFSILPLFLHLSHLLSSFPSLYLCHHTNFHCIGGHTGWSTAWEACLHARLRDSEGAMDAIGR